VRSALENRTDLKVAQNVAQQRDFVNAQQNLTLPAIVVASWVAGHRRHAISARGPRRADSPIITAFPSNYFDA
jgi:hypothetical protein